MGRSNKMDVEMETKDAKCWCCLRCICVENKMEVIIIIFKWSRWDASHLSDIFWSFASLPFWLANIGGTFLPGALKVGGCIPEAYPVPYERDEERTGCWDWADGPVPDGAGFFLLSLNCSREPNNGTFLLFLPAKMGLLLNFSKWMVLPDFCDK